MVVAIQQGEIRNYAHVSRRLVNVVGSKRQNGASVYHRRAARGSLQSFGSTSSKESSSLNSQRSPLRPFLVLQLVGT